METITLRNGVEMPLVGFGVYQIPAADCERCVTDALEVGYRLFDTAASYGNEAELGRALRRSGIARSELFVTTKLWLQDYGYKPARRAFFRSLDRLGLDYVDLYLLHKPLGDYYGAWRALEELYDEGRVRAIGVCNFYPDRLVDLVCNARIAPMLNQMETHVFWQHNGYQRLMARRGVQLQSWGSFAEGRDGFFAHPLLRSIAGAHGVSVAQVALRWLVQRGIVCIPKSVRRERMVENLDVFRFALTAGEMEALRTLNTHQSLFYSHTDPAKVEWLNSVRYDV